MIPLTDSFAANVVLMVLIGALLGFLGAVAWFYLTDRWNRK